MSTADGHRIYHVVVNDQGQYSIWADGRATPDGWRKVGVAGTKQECLDHITRSWVNVRP